MCKWLKNSFDVECAARERADAVCNCYIMALDFVCNAQ